MDCREVVQVVKDIKRRFGKEILSDKTKFLSAFDDFAPKLRKEKKILSFALDEQINYIFLDADTREAEKKVNAIKNAITRLVDNAWLSEQAARMIADCFAEALEWDISDFASVTDSAVKPQKTQAAAIQTKDGGGEVLYIKGEQAYAEENYKEAAVCFIMASVKGIPAAQNALAQCYEYGCGVPQDKLKAFEWYSKAANQGFKLAQYNIGRCYGNGIGTAENKSKAFEWHLKAAVQGHAVSQIYIGYEYFHGNSTGKNRRRAFEWYFKAANQGYAYAQNEVGYCYYNGYGITEDKSKAFEWYKKAAEQGNSAAQFNAGWCCHHGIGTEKNKKKAKYWYRKAADDGNDDAKDMLWDM